jgi:hypothetical protein
MGQVTSEALASPAATLDSEVVDFRSQLGETSSLNELVRRGAQRMPHTYIQAEVDEFSSPAQRAVRRNHPGPECFL